MIEAILGIVAFSCTYLVLRKVQQRLLAREKTLLENQRILKTTQQLARLGDWQWRPKQNQFSCSEELRQILGWPDSTKPGLHDYRASLYEEDRPAFDVFIKQLQATREIKTLESRVNSPDGDIKYVLQTAELIYDENQESRITCAVQDITERKNSQFLQEKMSHILEFAWDEIYLFAIDDFRILQISNGAREKLGMHSDKAATLSFLQIIADMDSESLHELIDPVLSGKQKYVLYEGYLKAENGDLHPVEMRMQTLDTGREPVCLAIAKDISERKRYVQELIARGLHDDLTGLPNRVLLRDRLTQAIYFAKRQKVGVALFVIDVLRLSEINDTLGHKYGDAVLQEVANRLQGRFRDTDTIARIAGDQFALVALGVEEKTVTTVVKEIHELTSEPLLVSDTMISVDLAVGVSLAPDHGESPQDLMRHADYAMRMAKHDNLEFNIYCASVDSYDKRHLQLYAELRQAVQNRTLTLYYQPKIDLMRGEVVSVEALARWIHPDRGMISPAEFVPMIERSGLITPFSKWVVEQAVSDAGVWLNEVGRVAVAANLSSRNLLDGDLPDFVESLVRQYMFPRELLTLEITESSVMANPGKAIETLAKLDRMGIKISIDDFGTGYSSLAYIKQLPVSELKIDASFVFKMVEDESDALIVKSTIDLSHSLGLTVIAEGVESEDSLDLLKSFGCDVGQGFLFGRPMPVPELKHWMKTSRWGLAQQKEGKDVATQKEMATLNKRVHQIMSHKPVIVYEKDSIAIALEKFREYNVSCLPVLNHSEQVVGVLTWRNLLHGMRVKKLSG